MRHSRYGCLIPMVQEQTIPICQKHTHSKAVQVSCNARAVDCGYLGIPNAVGMIRGNSCSRHQVCNINHGQLSPEIYILIFSSP